MRTIQKKIKFSKGQISERLLERTDLEVLDSSVSEITNLVSTPYGSVQTRQGTINEEVEFVSNIDFTVVDSLLVDDTDIPTGGFGETTALVAISDDTNILSIDFGSITTVNDLNFKCYFDGVGTDSMSYTVNFSGSSLTRPISSVTINSGSAYENISSVNVEITGGSDGVITGNINGDGTLTSFNVIAGGSYTPFNPSGMLDYSDYTTTTTTVTVQTSDDNSTWATIDTFAITNNDSTLKTVTIEDDIRYVRFITDACKGKLYIGAITAYETAIQNQRMKPFIFNDNEKYLIIMSDQVLTVYDGTTAVNVASAGLLDAYIPTVCVTQKEDVMIFTHPSMTPKQLVRTKPLGVVTWTFSDFTLENIPKYAFAGETSSSPIATNVTPNVTDGLVTLTLGTARTMAVGDYVDGGGGRVKITQVVSSTVYKGYTIIPFYTTAVFTNWIHITGYEDVWSSTRGYPTTCLFYQQRLWFGGSLGRPNTIWASRVDDYNNFLNVGNFNNDAIDVTIDANQSAEILALYPNRGIQVFCAGSEWIISEGNLTPNGISISKNTANGIKQGIAPVDISGTTLFIEKSGQSLLSFVYTDAQASYITSQISMLTDLIVDPIDMDVIYHSTQNKANYLYIVLSDGTMIVACILLDQQIQSFVKFETDGDIKDVCVLGDDVYLLVDRDTLTLEKFGDYKTDMTKSYAVAGDGTVTVDSIYEGKEVHAWSATEDYGTHTVSGGEITIDETTGNVFVGLDFDYSLTSNKIAINGQTGSIRTRISEAVIETNNTSKLTFNGSTKLSSNDRFMFNACSSPSRDTRFNIVGNFDRIEVLSILLRINYGTR